MKKWGCASLLVVALLIATVASSDADGRRGFRGGRHFHGGSRVFVGLGFGPAWWYPYPYWYYPPPYAYGPPTVVVQQPPVYVEQQPPAPPPAPPPPAAQQYLYYCEPAGGYYPSVQTCSDPWVKVPARSQ